MPIKPSRILVVKTHALGDVLMTTPAVRSLRYFYPGSKIDYLTGNWSKGALSGNPHIDSLITVDDSVFHKKQIGSIWNLIKKLQKGSYDLAIVFQPSALVHLLIRMAGVKRIAAPVTGSISPFVTFKSAWRLERDRYVVEDFCDVVRSLGVQCKDQSLVFSVSEHVLKDVQDSLEQYKIAVGEYVMLFPGGGRNPRDYVAQKIWPVENYLKIVERLIAHDIPVVLGGSQSDRVLASQLCISDDVINLAGETSLETAAAFMKNSGLILTNDSAPVHLALALKCRLLAIFGPSRRKALLPEQGAFLALEADFPCAPCYDNEPFKYCDRNDCIRSVSVEMVWSSILQMWEKRKASEI